MIAAAVFVVIQVFRERSVRVYPLPVLLIVFALQFDLMVALSRLGLGTTAAGVNRYTMPNLMLLCGIVMYAVCARRAESTREQPGRRARLRSSASPPSALLVVLQVVVATDFGLTYGRAQKQHAREAARVFVNLQSVPAAQRDCFLTAAIFSGPPAPDGRDTGTVRPGSRRLIERVTACHAIAVARPRPTEPLPR